MAFAHVSLSVVFLLLGVVLAGCVDPPDPVEQEEALPRLADLTACDLTYPDGSPVDCATDVALRALPDVPPGWVCIDKTPYGPPEARLYIGPSRSFAASYNGFAEGVTVGRFTLGSGPDAVHVDFSGSSSGFVAFPAAGPAAGNWQATITTMEVTGVPAVFDTSHLTMRTSHFEGAPWFVYVFDDGQQTYYHHEMAGPHDTGTLPYSLYNHEVQGEDFRFKSSVASSITIANNAYSVAGAVC